MRLSFIILNGKTKNVYFDTHLPDVDIEKIRIVFWNSDGQKQIQIDNLKLELYDGKN